MQGGGGGAAGSGPVKKVFVGGIAHGTTEDDIRAYFQQYGTVSYCFFSPSSHVHEMEISTYLW